MSSIRRILSGISTAATWATRLEVTAPLRQKQPTAPVEPVRRGFSDHSDFQSAHDAERSPLEAHAPILSGRSRKASDPLSAYTGTSDFQARLPRYQHLLGTNIPPPPARYWESWRSRSAASEPAPEQQAIDSGSRPGLTASSDLEKALELAGEDDSVLLYSGQEGEGGRSLLQHPDGSVTDPEDPENRLPDAQAWEAAHPELTRAASLTRNDLELVLAMPEGDARDEILSELADTGSGSTASLMDDGAGDGFMPSLDDLPVNADPSEEQEAASNGFAPSLDDLPMELGPSAENLDEQPASEEPVSRLLAASTEAVPLTPEELAAQLTPEGGLAEGRDPLGLAGQVALRGTPEQQLQVATALHEKSQTPDFPEASAYTRGAALAASGSPEAAQALLHRVGEANLADFVRTVMQA